MTGNPAAELVKPVSSDPIPDLAESVIGVSQYVSLSYWIGWSLKQITDVNPWLWIGEQISGDWETVQKAGIAATNLAEFNLDFARSISSGINDVSHDWQGVAADSASEYFSGLAKAIKEQEQTLKDIGEQFKTMSVGMYESANAIKGLLETLFDLLLAMGLEAAAAAASGWTVIGPILSGAAFAATLTKAIGVWGQVLEAHNHAWNTVQGVVGLIAGYASALQGIEKHALPAGNYNHPGV